MYIKTKEDILMLSKMQDELERKVIEVAEYLGIIDRCWHYESFDICEDRIHIVVYDYYYDLHDTKGDSFPIECVLDEEYLKNYKTQCEEAKLRYEEAQKLKKQKEHEEKERKELERLKAKYEGK